MKKQLIITCLFMVMLVDAHAGMVAKRWSKITTPTLGASESIGSYTAGCLRGAATLPAEGTGYQVMRLSRNRYYGHLSLIQFIQNLGRESYTKGLGTILVGDLGQPRGAPMVSGHRSHQTGLDVDMWFLLSPEANSRSLTRGEREKWGAPSVLRGHSDEIDLVHWSIANEQILELAARMPEVDRIFVNPSIKRHLCNQPGNHDWLRKIRPWWRHDDHFHVRLKCPPDSTQCQSQPPVPRGDGCDASLAWWFSAEAKTPSKKPPVVREPILPATCEAVYNE